MNYENYLKYLRAVEMCWCHRINKTWKITMHHTRECRQSLAMSYGIKIH